MIPRVAIALVLTFGTLLWLILLLGSTLFPPKRDSAMRFAEKALVLISGVLLVTWTVLLLAGSTPPA